MVDPHAQAFVDQELCSIEGCCRQQRARGWCGLHWRRWRDHGDPHYVPFSCYPSFAERVWEHIDTGHPSGCWMWTAYIGPKGYGQANLGGGKHQPAHRAVYEVLRGPVPDGLDVDHLCRNRACVNPDHLEPVTRSENARRGAAPMIRRFEGLTRTHCKWGHPFSGENLYIAPSGERQCRTCRAERLKATK